jgi:hypothetical protein
MTPRPHAIRRLWKRPEKPPWRSTAW